MKLFSIQIRSQTRPNPMVGDIKDELFKQFWEKETSRIKTHDWDIYKSLSDKDGVFEMSSTIKSTSELLSFVNFYLPEITEGQKLIYRGMNEAKYRLFSSSQRAFRANHARLNTDQKAYDAGIIQMIENARKVHNGVLPNFFKATGLKDSDVSVLSFLQHFGAPTPFTDWTTDIYAALYFATDRISDEEILKYYHSQDGDDIDDYVSLYIMIEEQILEKISDFKQLSLTSKNAVHYKTLKKKHLQYIEEKYKSGKPVFALFNNFRITNQKGLFIYNNSSHLPLEEMFLTKWLMFYLINNSKGLTATRSPIICINIHKSIIYTVKEELLKPKGYTKAAMYPEAEDIARMSVPDVFRPA